MFHHATVGIVVIGKDGCIILSNPIVEKLFGYENKELIGRPIEILIPDNLRERHKQHRDDYFEAPKARPMGFGMDLFARHKNGSSFPVEISLCHYMFGDSQLAVAFITDISERKRAEYRLGEESDWLCFLNKAMNRLWDIRNLKDGLEEVLSTSMELLCAEKGNIQLLDAEKQVLVIAVHHGFDKAFLDHFKEVSAGSDSVCGIAFGSRKQIVVDDVNNAPFFAAHLQVAKNSGFRAVQSTPLYNHEGIPIAMVSTHSAAPGHFTEQSLHRMELYARYAESFLERINDRETIKRINFELEQKVKDRTHKLVEALEREKEFSQMKSSFVSMASHEFRTPLTVVLSSANLIGQYTQSDQQEQREKHLARIKSSTRHLVNLLDDLLSVGKLEEGRILVEPEGFDFEEFIQAVSLEFEGIKKEQQYINCSYTGDRIVEADKKIWRNILVNLLSNAIKYSEQYVDLTVEVTANHLSVSVKDRGIGIPEGQQKEIFGKFFRAKNTGTFQGTGLGLNIVKLYVELLGGTIDFVSKENAGTTFTVVCPTVPEQYLAATDMSAQNKTISGARSERR